MTRETFNRSLALHIVAAEPSRSGIIPIPTKRRFDWPLVLMALLLAFIGGCAVAVFSFPFGGW